jgi:hypothetical protein
MSGVVTNERIINGEVEILIDGDPFPVMVARSQLTTQGGSETTMTTASTRQPTAKDLRRQAKTAGIEGYMEMSREELIEALESVEGGEQAAASRSTRKTTTNGTGRARRTKAAEAEAPAKPARSTAKKAAPAKAAAKATAEKADGPNPFRSGTNLWHITEALMRGGKRSDLVVKLRNKLSFNPRVKSADDFDTDLEIDRRLKVIAYLLKNQHGWEFQHDGRGSDAFIKVTPPDA